MAIDTVPVGEPGNAEALTIADSALAFTSGTYIANGIVATKAVFVLEGGQVRFTVDGSTVGTATGHLIEIGDVVTVEGRHAVRNFSAIRTGATSGTAWVTYFR